MFQRGYLVTDFIYQPGSPARSFYVLSNGESTCHYMKIERITLYHLRMPLRTPFETSFGRITTRDCLLVEAFSEGLVGYGECVADRDPGYSYETSATAWYVLSEFIIPSILNQELEGPQDFLRRTGSVRGHPMAKAGLEMALVGPAGQAPGSLAAPDAGRRPRTRFQWGCRWASRTSPEALVKVVEGYLAQGYRRIKIKIKPGRDVEDARAVRHALSQECACRWTPTRPTRWKTPRPYCRWMIWTCC